MEEETTSERHEEPICKYREKTTKKSGSDEEYPHKVSEETIKSNFCLGVLSGEVTGWNS